MNYTEWLKTVDPTITGDVLWKMEVYRLALFATELAWKDTTKLMQDQRTARLAGQLYSASGSISANISEGYSRQSKRDQARYYEYALGSARECRGWYYQGRHVLGETVTVHRLSLITQIIRHLLRIIPAERGPIMKEDVVEYAAGIHLNDIEDPPDESETPSSQLDATRNT